MTEKLFKERVFFTDSVNAGLAKFYVAFPYLADKVNLLVVRVMPSGFRSLKVVLANQNILEANMDSLFHTSLMLLNEPESVDVIYSENCVKYAFPDNLLFSSFFTRSVCFLFNL